MGYATPPVPRTTSSDIIEDLDRVALAHRVAALSGDLTRRLELAMEIEKVGTRIRERIGENLEGR